MSRVDHRNGHGGGGAAGQAIGQKLWVELDKRRVVRVQASVKAANNDVRVCSVHPPRPDTLLCQRGAKRVCRAAHLAGGAKREGGAEHVASHCLFERGGRCYEPGGTSREWDDLDNENEQ